MQINQVIDSNNGKEKLLVKQKIWNEIKDCFTNPQIRMDKGDAPYIKREVAEILTKCGWAENVKISPSNLSINFLKNKIGLCLQLGNYARVYADLLKLQLMYEKDTIEIGIIAVPFKDKAKLIGSNVAQFERLTAEIKLFCKIIHLPLVIIGLDN